MLLILAILDPKNVKFHEAVLLQMKTLIFNYPHIDIVTEKIPGKFQVILAQKVGQSTITF